MKLFLDFDWTLICENSSRKLEEIIYKNLENNFWKKMIYFIFFSGFSKIFSIMFAGISRFFYEKKDLRLYIFLKITQKELIKNQEKIFQELSQKLIYNKEIYNYIIGKNFSLISNGIDIVIEKFIILDSLKVEKIFASTLKMYDWKISLDLKNFANKLWILQKIDEFEYLTDDYDEVLFLQSGIKGMELSKLWEIYILKKFKNV